MNKELEESFKLLNNEILWVCLKWQIYNQLFGTSEENIKLLNKVSPISFKIFQDSLFNDVILTICKITDPPTMFKKENLTIDRIINLINIDKHEDLYNKLVCINNNLKLSCRNIKELRNKKIGHFDLESMKSDYTSINVVSRKMINCVLEDIYKFMNEINLYFDGCPKQYEFAGAEGNAGNILIRELKKIE